MHKRNTTYCGKIPKKIISQKVKLINPNSSPTPSPIKKVRHFCCDRYLVTDSEAITIFKTMPSLVNASFEDISPAQKNSSVKKNLIINTETAEFKTPTINFVPKRPKKFNP